jgi:hypothetical protein
MLEMASYAGRIRFRNAKETFNGGNYGFFCESTGRFFTGIFNGGPSIARAGGGGSSNRPNTSNISQMFAPQFTVDGNIGPKRQSPYSGGLGKRISKSLRRRCDHVISVRRLNRTSFAIGLVGRMKRHVFCQGSHSSKSL